MELPSDQVRVPQAWQRARGEAARLAGHWPSLTSLLKALLFPN